jgi:hypothetical protein
VIEMGLGEGRACISSLLWVMLRWASRLGDENGIKLVLTAMGGPSFGGGAGSVNRQIREQNRNLDHKDMRLIKYVILY